MTAVPRARLALVLATLLTAAACEERDPDLLPDAQLRAELGLTDDDRVHTVLLSTAEGERAEPDSLEVLPGDLVQLVSDDWMVHEVAFDLEAAAGAARSYLERTGQAHSPPLLQRGARFVLTFADAPPGRYPYRLTGNRAGGEGVIVVAAVEGR